MLRLFKRLLMLIGLAVALWFGAHFYAAWKLRTALIEGGMNEKAAACMSRRLSKRLTLWQMHKLEAYAEERGTPGGFLRASRRIDDRKVVLVTATSAALCTTGLAH